jgi:peptide-methionine (R)-S-oxide reductase
MAKAKTIEGFQPLEKSRAEWKKLLPADRYAILFKESTERPFSNPLNGEKRAGTFICAACFLALFSSEAKFESGTGWPSFFAPIDGAIETSTDRSHFMVRTEVHCSRCGGHLGHVFPDGPPPTGDRYCINGVAMHFSPTEE